MKKLIILCLICNTLSVFAQQTPDLYTRIETSYNNSDFEGCVSLAKDVESFVAGKSDTLSTNLLFYLGDSFVNLGNETEAIRFFEKENQIIRTMPGRSEVSYSNSLYNLAFAYLRSGRYADASRTADELLKNDQKLYETSSPEFAETVLSVSDIFMAVDRLDDAEKMIKNTLKRQPKNTVLEGRLLTELGDLYSYRSQFAQATKTLEQAVEILYSVAGEDSQEYGNAAIALGILYMGQGKYPQAEEIFDVALSIIDPQGESYPAAINNQALVYRSLGQLDKSVAMFKKVKVLDSLALGTEHPDYATTLSNLSQALTDAGNYSEAEQAIKTAIEIQKRNKDTGSINYARFLTNLARTYEKSGKPEKSVPLLLESLKIFKKLLSENSPEYATATYTLGNAYVLAGKGAEGIKHLKTSAVIRSRVLGKNHPKYAESMQRIGEYQWQQKQLKEARQSFGQVFDNSYFQIENTFPGLTEEEKSNFFYNNIKGNFEKFNSFTVASHTMDPLLLDDMYNYHVNTKGAIMYATEKVRKAILSSNDSSLIKLFEDWQLRKEQIARAYSQNMPVSALDSMMNAANAIEKDLTKRSAVFASQFDRQRVTWQQIQQTLKPGEACIEVIRFRDFTPEKAGKFTDNVTYAYLVITADTKDHPILVSQSNGAEMENKFIKYYHNNIRYNMDDLRSHKNFFSVLDEILAKRGIKKFYFSPDGVYNQLNLNSLKNPATQKYLVDEYDIRFVTNSKDLLEKKEQIAVNQSPILIGFPKFNVQKVSAENGSEAGVTRGGRTRGATRGGLTREMRGLMRLMRGDEGISELPGTQKEINEISGLFKTTPKVYLATQATEDIAKGVNNPPYLHIATHGYFLEDEEGSQGQYVSNPLLKAGLILSGAENFLLDGEPVNDAGDDGILTAYEAMNLRLDNTRLVVLSACETGLGKVKNGEGVYGLQRAFRLAGTQSIVMSLWSVDDDATQELMSTFYAELMKNGNQHEAFRTAQQRIKEKFKTPFYWGAFVMVGN